MKQLYSAQISILNYVEKNVYIDKFTASRLFSVTSDYYIDQLFNEGYLRKVPSHDPEEIDWYVLSDKGRAYIEDFRSNQSEEYRMKRIESYRFWIPITINSVLSIFAIIISVITLLKQ